MKEETAKTMDERRQELQVVFTELEDKEKELREQGAEINRKLTLIGQDKLRLQGAHAVLTEDFSGDITGASKLETPKETTVKKRESTKKK